MLELVCSVIKQAAGSNFTLPALKLLVYSARKLATILTMLNIVDTVSTIIQNWLV